MTEEPAMRLTRAAARDIDRRAIEEYGLPGVILMENAGSGCARLLQSLGVRGPIVICCGKGNNGGDGYVIARHLDAAGIDVHVVLIGDSSEVADDARMHFDVLRHCAIAWSEHPQPTDGELDGLLSGREWIVDALLGTGIRGAPRPPHSAAIAAINRSAARVLAVDLPSGLDCDTGAAPGECVRADHTATFIARKAGFDHPAAAGVLGTVHVVDLGIPRNLLSQF